ncbi:MAG: hypothetical protein UU73_C0001G0203 [Candidatus Daviesbacteria bacterium GW2011_GWA1_41_61]|uniref:Mannosyltransferase n=1 Tax=Candidatus Daviesbacteria bacterium GW2011_GWA2_40_9 TaxID=1618424 RepID=A0A0G0U5V4_9BACT|nr:MAG: hypothetical protein UU26_C0028G0006 [Candidatus Daviesbacteria bacterium GW2011_GWC1_40_9]KKR82571.1 MAG: hypothetical protein UU29_C0011G0018 [Candidatus Daviesbacteria bacterium GW2011_GWA2_40_9]KKR93022.1 MAG: hypothetical protein UU44_C0004G0204 [Candidatus Daviesbacteria bacterium GW2011_GWB1_41_15]KKS15566.1 MAG: hypothetical protein UU73_C0001G0203 [Candidatus Daviesbacteria bacterium GW2011_GWA1_41_61]
MSQKFWIVLTVGLILRLTLGAITYHSDIRHLDLAGYVIGGGNLLNFYDFVSGLSAGDPIVKTYPAYPFNYPPMVYFFLGGFSWLTVGWINPSFHLNFLVDVAQVLGQSQLYLHLLLLKIPYLLFDLPLAFLLAKFFDSPKEKFLAFTLWIFNPVNLYATYMMGQFDVIPVFFSTLALYLVLRQKGRGLKNLLLSALLLGAGASFKIYPLFFLIPLASLATSWKERVGVVTLGLLPYLVTILPFIHSFGFRSTALVANQTLKSLYPQIAVSGGEAIFLFLILLTFLYLVMLTIPARVENLWQRFFIALIPFFIFTHFHPQWFLWLAPFIILSLVKEASLSILPAAIMMVTFAGMIFFFDPGLSLGLFSPLNSSLYNSPSIWKILSINPDYNFARSLLQTGFAGGALYFIYHFFPKKADS